MSAPAAFKATYSDLRFVKSRKVAQVMLELPIEQADAFVKAFGTPNPASETWVGIARLDISKVANEAPKAKRQFCDLPPAQQAALRCNEPAFWTFLATRFAVDVIDADRAAEEVRIECDVASRSELNSNKAASERWKALDDAYWGWSRGLE